MIYIRDSVKTLRRPCCFDVTKETGATWQQTNNSRRTDLPKSFFTTWFRETAHEMRVRTTVLILTSALDAGKVLRSVGIFESVAMEAASPPGDAGTRRVFITDKLYLVPPP